jgi:OOP family OmpA-OmpF porin
VLAKGLPVPAKTNAGRLSACALLLIALPSTAAQADKGGDMELQSFQPALDSKGMVTLDRSQVLGHLEPSFGLVTNWAAGLLQLEGQGNSYDVEHILSPTLVGALGLRPFGLNLQLALSLPFRVVSGDRGPDDNGGTADDPNDDKNYSFEGQGLGNIDTQLKWRVLNTSHSPVGLALIAGVELPTTSADESWLGADTTTPHLRVALDRRQGSFGMALNLGMRLPLSESEFVDDTPPVIDGISGPMTGERIASGISFPFGVGISYELVPQQFDLVGEVFGQYAPNADNYQPLEALAGAKFYLAQNSFLSFGAGRGLLPGKAGSPDWRGYLGIVFEPNVGDRDRDGLKDDVDMCPDSPEDYDDFQDTDGCPELDNDLDLILDVEDQCPNTPEDRDGIDDDDGCPETEAMDRDGDRILDDEDECPDDPEDYDQFQDSDGCPDYDNDGDRILDVDDECPRIDGEPAHETMETYNTVDDEDGCPDRGPVSVTNGQIVTLSKIHFEYNSDVIKDQSFDILHAIAMTIDTNPGIELVEVQGHTDERGSRMYNQDLSQRRAESVVRFLVKDGIARKRLEPIGYGEDEPKMQGHDEQSWAANRRVQFMIR